MSSLPPLTYETLTLLSLMTFLPRLFSADSLPSQQATVWGIEHVPIILYIDTDQLYMSAIKLLLEQHGFKVLLARTHEHMREVLLTGAVDLALVDCDFAREFPNTVSELHLIAPLTRTVLLGMRSSERPADAVDAYCARLDGPEKLVAVLKQTISVRVKGALA